MKYMPLFFILTFFLSACGGGGSTTDNSTSIPVASITTIPLNNEQHALINTPISLQINRPFTNADLSKLSFSIVESNSTTSLNGKFGLIGDAIYFTPNLPLEFDTTYEVSFRMMDSSIDPINWSFTTISDPDPFSLTIEYNLDGNLLVLGKTISIQLSKPINPLTVGYNEITLTDSMGLYIPIDVHFNEQDQIIIILDNYLNYASDYTLSINGDWYSLDGTLITPNDKQVTFTTEIDSYSPIIESMYPIDGYVNVDTKSDIYIYFDGPLNSDSISSSKITLTDMATNQALPFILTLEQDNKLVRVNPQSHFLYNSVIQFSIDSGLEDLSGNVLSNSIEVSFTVESDRDAPSIISITPAPGTLDIPLDTSFIIEFDENINPEYIDENGYYLNKDSTYGTNIPTLATVSGNKLIITPVQPLKYQVNYTMDLDNSYSTSIEDLNGNEKYSFDSWSFSTGDYSNFLQLNVAIDSFEFDSDNNFLYALNNTNKRIYKIDLTTDEILLTQDLLQAPSRMCIDNVNDKIYITNTTSNSVTELNSSTFETISSITWPSPNWGHETAHYHIRCTEDNLFISTAEWAPRIYKIDRNDTSSGAYLDTIEGIGDFQINSQGDIYSWYQYGWSAGYAGSRIERFSESPDTWKKVDESSQSYPNHDRDPLDSPLLMDEVSGRIINKRYLFNSLNLEQILYDFGDNAVIYAADFNRNRASTMGAVYSLDTFSITSYLPLDDIDNLIFDNEGDLYMLRNSDSALYILPQEDL
jgi:hypothetical protein